MRGQRVMLDSDLALLYGVETRRLNEQVRRNPGRFALDFVCQLREDEFKALMSQCATSNDRTATSGRGGHRKLPLVSTEGHWPQRVRFRPMRWPREPRD